MGQNNQMNKNFLNLFLLLSVLILGPAIFSEEAQANGMSYEQKLQACGTCHGADGDKPLAPNYPILAGQHEDYLANSLKAYKDGRRKHPIMNVQVQVLDLSDADIARLSSYFSKKPGLKGLGE